MHGLLCYYSGSGNTRLVCRYLARTVTSCRLELLDVRAGGAPELGGCDVAGFATFTDAWSVPPLMRSFMEGLAPRPGRPAFVLNTYGFVSGRTLAHLGRLAGSRGFVVVAGHSLHCPESYPPMVAAGLGNEGHPDPREVAAFERFARGLDRTLALIGAGSAPARARLGTGVLNALLSPVPRGVARRFTRWTMGRKRVDPALCRRCGLCATVCPYGAVSLGPGAGALPAFDEGRCESCWSCYNHCPAKAIHTARHRGVGHYPRPNEHVRRALGASAGD